MSVEGLIEPYNHWVLFWEGRAHGQGRPEKRSTKEGFPWLPIPPRPPSCRALARRLSTRSVKPAGRPGWSSTTRSRRPSSSTRRKPRWPVRNLFHTVDLSRSARTFWVRDAVGAGRGRPRRLRGRKAGTGGRLQRRPDARPACRPLALGAGAGGAAGRPGGARALLQLPYRDPAGHRREPGADRRAGRAVQTSPKSRRSATRPASGSALYAACDEIEQMGCTADGAVFNPHDYWLLRRYDDRDPGAGGSWSAHRPHAAGARAASPWSAISGMARGCSIPGGRRWPSRSRRRAPWSVPGCRSRPRSHERILMHLPATFYRVRLYG